MDKRFGNYFLGKSHFSYMKFCFGINFAIISGWSVTERGVPQAYVRARASSATLCSVHVLRVFLCIFYFSKRESDTSKRAWIHI